MKVNITCEKIDLNQQIFAVVTALAAMQAENDPRCKAYRKEHEREISTCVLFEKMQYDYIMEFYPQESSWRQLGALPIGVCEDKKEIWLLLSNDNLLHSNDSQATALISWGGVNHGKEKLELKPAPLQQLTALFGDRIIDHDLHCYCVPQHVVDGANDEFFSGHRLRDGEKRRQEQEYEEDVAGLYAEQITLIDAVDDKDIEKIAVERAMSWLRKALGYRATDVHIEPFEKSGRVRFRIDGDLQEIETRIAPADMRRAVSWLKVQAKVDLNAGLKPLDGKIKLGLKVKREMHQVDVRFSSIPTIYGDKVVLRILDKSQKSNNKASEDLLNIFKFDRSEPRDSNSYGYGLFKTFSGAVDKSSGIVLVTGPTGSGKTTTLNTALKYLLERHGVKRNITTIEDPVEYSVEGASQVQTEPKAGLTFASALRSLLRQDPDIVLVGEIRDSETAQIAVQAALTGHMILSTLHTNDAIGCVERLEDLGVSPFLIGSTVRLFQAQRLVQKLCGGGNGDSGCAEPMSPDEVIAAVRDGVLCGFEKEFRERLEQGGTPMRCAENGCEKCRNRGYNGRLAVSEMIDMNSVLSSAIQSRCARSELVEIAKKHCGYRSILDYGTDMFFKGVTDFENVSRLFTGN